MSENGGTRRVSNRIPASRISSDRIASIAPYSACMRSIRLIGALLAVCLLVVACGDDTDTSQATSDSIKKQIEDAESRLGQGSTPVGSGLECPKQEATVGRMRVVNLAMKADGTEVGPVDVYADGYGPDLGCKPVISSLGFGDASNYIDVPATPHVDPPEGGLSYFDAGTTDRSGFWKGQAPNDGVDGTGDQETVILTGGSDSGKSFPTWTNVVELSKDNPALNVKPAAPGKGLLLVNGSAAMHLMSQAGNSSVLTLSIDGRCLHRDDEASVGDMGVGSLSGNGVPYSVDPGQHEIGIIVTDPGVGIGGEDCDGRTPSFTGTVEVGADEATAVYLGGPSPVDLRVYAARLDL